MMTETITRNKAAGGTAAIATLDLVAAVLERLTGRAGGLPGLGALYGPAGWGKSFCANAIANRERGYYVQMRSAWRGKSLLEKILFEMGIKAKGTVSQLLDAVCEQLAASRRPLIIDEFDHCAKSDTLVELVRDIYEGSQGAILLIGEEGLPRTLERWERFHSRVLAWAPAQPVSEADAAKLAGIYCPDVALGDDLVAHLVAIAAGSVRRVCVNLTLIHEECLTGGEEAMSLARWGGRPLYTGKSPERRV
jgi:hypothetical protein